MLTWVSQEGFPNGYTSPPESSDMSRIQQLDTHVINRIAAGEVIERPASVVKELLENSVDALSTRIDVQIVDGGMELIRIADNGEGIHHEDMLLAVTSHATSKIRSDADLDHVATLGFRGEALASIASVSRFRISTRTEDSNKGRELESHGGNIITDTDCGCSPGTVMEVRNLFFNTPARRRFLKKASTEFSRIVEQFSRVALANPALALTLRHNDRLVYELPATTDPLQRIRRFYNAEVSDKLISVESSAELPEVGAIRLWGYVGEPSLNRATRKDQYLFLNGRWIQDRSLQHALLEAYRGLLMTGRHPVSFLFLEIPPALVDVNVHPTKSEVRFQDGQNLYRHLLKTLRDKFLALEFRTEFDLNQPAATGLSTTRVDSAPSVSVPRQMHLPPATNSPGTFRDYQPGTGQQRAHSQAVFHNPDVVAALAVDHHLQQQGTAPHTATNPSPQHPSAVASASFEAAPEIVTDEFRAFQIYDCYLVVASDSGLEIIDQHALHERIMYESIRERILSGTVETQKLLVPDVIECSAVETEAILESAELFQEMGFDIQSFGGTSVILNSCPALIPRGRLTRIIRDFAERLLEADGRMSRRDLLENMLSTMACRAAIKSGQRLTTEEMQELLRQRHLVDDSHHCPHGRPTALVLNRHSLDQRFGRLG